MLSFKPITIQNQAVISDYVRCSDIRSSSYCFVDLLIWQRQFNTQFCIADDLLFIKMRSYIGDRSVYLMPVGSGNFANGILRILEDAGMHGQIPVITALSAEGLEKIEHLFPNRFSFCEMRGSEDYIYRSEDLIDLCGRKFHEKKNHINHFRKTYAGRWHYGNMSESDMGAVLSFHEQWMNSYSLDKNRYLLGERQALICAFHYFDRLKLRGSLLYLDHRLIGFAIGIQGLNDTFIVQFEKADRKIVGAYQMINQLFAQHHCRQVQWINREEDLGIKGLRRAKLTYHPVWLNVEYQATCKREY